MQAVVKTRRTEIRINGQISGAVLNALVKEYGDKLKILNDEGEEIIPFRETKWFKETEKNMNPGKSIRICRENAGLTQGELGEKMNSLSAQVICDLENGRRKVSINMAKKLAKVFKKPVDRFLDLKI